MSSSSSSSSGSGWSKSQNKLFEKALAVYDQDTPDRWQKVARYVGDGKSADDAKRHYELLVDDVQRIESGLVQYPNYRSSGSGQQNRHMSYN